MIENEKIVLSSLIFNPKHIQNLEYLKPEHFISEENAKIYKTILELNGNFDIQILVEKTGVNISYFNKLLQYHGLCEEHAKRIVEDYIKRKIWSLGSLDNSDAFEMLDTAEKTLYDLEQSLFSYSKFANEKDLLQEYYEHHINIKQNQSKYLIKSGFYDLDELIGGFIAGSLYIIASRPSQGKTSLALSIANEIAKNKKAGFFSIEMSSLQIAVRLIGIKKGLSVQKLLEGRLLSEEMQKIDDLYSKAGTNLIVDDTAGIHLLELRSKCKKLVRDGISIVFIDYLQLIRTDMKESREREVSYISQQLKMLAKELNIPVVVLCQLNRNAELRASKEPELADLRESGSIEQDADVVILLWRPEFYGIEQDSEGNNLKGIAKLKIAKNRNGALGKCDLIFDAVSTAFKNKFNEPLIF